LVRVLDCGGKPFFSQSAPLGPRQREALAGFFDLALLDAVRLLALHGARVEGPAVLPYARGHGLSNLSDFSGLAATPCCDIIVSYGALADVLLFHELVHVEQYRQLGIQGFSELFGTLRSWIPFGRGL